MFFPWQQKQWQQVWRAKQENRLPHALLFAGIAGIGKAKFADHLSRVLLCKKVSANGDCCHDCHDCRLIEGNTHPNVLLVGPEKEGQAIKVDQIRAVSEFINQTSLQGEYRVVVINHADNMNVSAANALLKTLEEPSSGAMLLLVCDQASQLPATILSRCQRISFPAPDKDQALQWMKENLSEVSVDHQLLLNLANGAPLAATKLIEDDVLSIRSILFDALSASHDPVKVAASLKDVEPLYILDFALSWMSDLIKLQFGEDNIVNTDYAEQLKSLNQKSDVKRNAKFMEYLSHLRRDICRGINFNKQLMIEDMLMKYV